MGTYVVGDIHGCYDQFITLKNRIESQDVEAHFILVGDIIDRGPKVMDMLHWAMDNCNKPEGKYELLLGNHEYEKLYLLRENLRLVLGDKINNSYNDSSVENPSSAEKPSGAGKKFNSDRKIGSIRAKRFKNKYFPDYYGFDSILEHNKVTYGEAQEIYEFFESMPPIKELDINGQHYIIVHGGLRTEFVNDDETFNTWYLSDEASEVNGYYGRESVITKLVWDRFVTEQLEHTIVVVGHTPTNEDQDAKGRILFSGRMINVDCGCVFQLPALHTNLAAIRLEDLEEFYLYDPPMMTEKNRENKEKIKVTV